jgi:magnesium transporter
MPRNLMANLALGRAIVNQPLAPVAHTASTEDPLTQTKKFDMPSKKENEKNNLGSLDGIDQSLEGKPKDVTYRELLGGFLHPRDLRKLVSPFSASNEPELIVRRHAMLLNFDPLRAIILRDRLLVLVPDGADSILVQLEQMIVGESENGDGVYGQKDSLDPVKEDPKNDDDDDDDDSVVDFESSTEPPLQLPDSDKIHAKSGIPDFVDQLENQELFKTLGQNEWAEMEGNTWIDLPFELQSVDAILNSVCSILADDIIDLQVSANSMITELLTPGADVGDHAQEILRTMKNSVKELMSRVDGFRRAMDNTLEDYEDMALMNLSRILTHPDRFIQPVLQSVLDEESDEPELILEAHLQRGHTLTNALHLVQGQINSTEEYAVRKSDSIRNRLLYINMLISLLSLAVAGSSLVGSLFGMNVMNPLEEEAWAFSVLIGSTIGGSLFFVILVFLMIRRFGVLPRVL